GSGVEVSIKELAETIAKVVGYKGDILWDTSKPDGTLRKLMDSSKIKAIEWEAKTTLEYGIQSAYADFILVI
ncbi:MAG: GDP-fucose synthetase, partial [Puniceicoccaceae bacterium]|nr:GDP-fucose synthetase [Puniceicoccaceae bacterium]